MKIGKKNAEKNNLLLCLVALLFGSGVVAFVASGNPIANMFAFSDESETHHEDRYHTSSDDEGKYVEQELRAKRDFIEQKWKERNRELDKMRRELEKACANSKEGRKAAEQALAEWKTVTEKLRHLLSDQSYQTAEELFWAYEELNRKLEDIGHWFWEAVNKCHDLAEKHDDHKKHAAKDHSAKDSHFPDDKTWYDQQDEWEKDTSDWEDDREHEKAELFRLVKEKKHMIEELRYEIKKQVEEGARYEEKNHCVDELQAKVHKLKELTANGNIDDAWHVLEMIDEKEGQCWAEVEREWETWQPEDDFDDQHFPGYEHDADYFEDDDFDTDGFHHDEDDAYHGDVPGGFYGTSERKTRDDWSADRVRYIERDMKHTLEELTHAKKRLAEMEQQGIIDAGQAEECEEVMQYGESIINEALAASDGAVDRKMPELERLRPKAERICSFLFEHDGFARPDVEGFVEEDFHGMEKEKMKKIMEQVRQDVMHEVMKELSSMDPELVDGLMRRADGMFDQEAGDFLEVIPQVPLSHQQEFVAAKAEILQQMQELQELRHKLQAEKKALQQELTDIENIQKRIAGYNFYGQSGERIKSEIAEFIDRSEQMSETELQQAVRKLEMEADREMENARKEKFREGIIPFEDTDDNHWFTPYVSTLKQKGVISGKTDQSGKPIGYDPGGQVTVAEALKISLEAAGEGQAHMPEAGEHWAAGYQARASEHGINVNRANLDRPARRGEVIMLLVKFGGLELVEASESSCPDVSTSHPLFRYIETARQYELIQGDGDTGNCRPDDKIDRAETAKIASALLELSVEE